MEKAYKYRIYPNEEQEILIQKTFGCSRFVYNHYLAKKITLYKERAKPISYDVCSSELTKLKMANETVWLKEVDKFALQASLKHLDFAYQNFFRRVKSGSDKVGFPKFKSKKDKKKSYQTNFTNNNITVEGNCVKLPKLGRVKASISKQAQGRVLNATVSQSPSGKYFVSICCTDVETQLLPKTGAVVGLDLGIKSLVVSSDQTEYANHKFLAKSQNKLTKLQRQLSRKTKGSSRRNKARIKVARLHERISNQRTDSLHKLTSKLIKDYDIICIEDLAVKNMVRNRKLAKSISDVSWGEFRRQLAYKADWYGKELIVIDRFYPSSQICSACGGQWAGTKDLSVREWVCPDCGAVLNRDYNATINIKNEGLRQMA